MGPISRIRSRAPARPISGGHGRRLAGRSWHRLHGRLVRDGLPTATAARVRAAGRVIEVATVRITAAGRLRTPARVSLTRRATGPLRIARYSLASARNLLNRRSGALTLARQAPHGRQGRRCVLARTVPSRCVVTFPRSARGKPHLPRRVRLRWSKCLLISRSLVRSQPGSPRLSNKIGHFCDRALFATEPIFQF
jgi:hypothetical protein